MNTIEKSIELSAPIGRVWMALTDHRQHGQWFRAKIDKPFAIGSRSTFRCLYPGYEHIKWDALVEKMDHEKLFSYTSHMHPLEKPDEQLEVFVGNPTLVEYALQTTPQGTRLTVIESGYDKIPADKRALAMRNNDNGWEMQLQNIAEHLANESSVLNG